MRRTLFAVNLFAAMVGSVFAVTIPNRATPLGRVQPESIPRYFEANRGQWPAGQAYRAFGFGYGVVLGARGVTFQVADRSDAKQAGRAGQSALPGAVAKAEKAREVSLRFEGANGAARLTGLEELGARGAWFQGAETEWGSDIPLYGRVRIDGIYSGVSATFYAREGRLEYDLDVAPGARANSLVLDLEGADGATIDRSGDLRIEAGGREMVLEKPLAWQAVGRGRKGVEAGYRLLARTGRAGQRIGFQLKGYDASKALTIDPVLTFATYLSSPGSTQADYSVIDLALDRLNNIYVLSADLHNTAMTVQKFTPGGSMVYTATFSATGNLYPAALRVNALGQAYVAATAGAGFPTTTTGYQPGFPNAGVAGSGSCALSVISADGSSLVYSTYFGGQSDGDGGSDIAFALAVDGSGEAYLAGQAGGDDFPATSGAYRGAYSGGNPAAFVAKFNPGASGAASLVYSTLLGGKGTYARGVAVDGANNAYLALSSVNCNVPVTPGAQSYSGMEAGTGCGYVTAIDPGGTALVYSAYLGPGTPEAIAVDGSGNAYAAGDSIQADDFPTTAGAYQGSYPDGFALELNAAGGLVYATFLGGPSGGNRNNQVNPQSIALLPGCKAGCVAYIAGAATAGDFPVVNGLSGAPAITSPSYPESFLVALNGTGSSVLTSGYLSGLNSSILPANSGAGSFTPVAVDSGGDAWLAGTLSSSMFDFPVTTAAQPGLTGSWLAEVSMASGGNVIAVPQSLAFNGRIPVNLSSVAYGALYGNSPATVYLRNLGSAAVAINSIAASPAIFTESDTCSGQIAAASFCAVTIEFAPTSDEMVYGTLTVMATGLTGTLVIPLSGQGLDTGFVVATPDSLNFGNQTINAASAPQTVTLTNVGDEPATDVNSFSFSPQMGFSGFSNCTSTLAPGNSCQVQVTFAPAYLQLGAQAGTLANPLAYPPYAVALAGTGVLASGSGGTLAGMVSFTTLNFGTETIGAASGTQYDTVTNTGSLQLSLLQPFVTLTSGHGAAADFQAGGIATGGQTLGTQGGLTFYVTFTPSVTGTETATLTIPVAGLSTVYTVLLVGQGSANTQTLEIQPSGQVFPDQVVGTASAAQSFTLFNAGNAPLLVDRVLASGDFSIARTTCPGMVLAGAIAPGDVSGPGCLVSVVFTPSQTGGRSGTLTVYDAISATPQSFPLAGNGVAVAQKNAAVLSPTVAGFPDTAVGTLNAALEQVVTLTNSGSLAFTVGKLTGTNVIAGNLMTGEFTTTGGGTYDHCGGQTVAAGASCAVNLGFQPGAAGARSGSLVFPVTYANTSTPVSLTTMLAGNGIAANAAVTISPAAIQFAPATAGAGIQANYQDITVANTGNVPVKFTSTTPSTGFALAGDGCTGATLNPGGSCTDSVYFNPSSTTASAISGTLSIKDSATGSPQTVSLKGTGLAAGAGLVFSETTVPFSSQVLLTHSGPLTIYLINLGSTAVTIDSLALGGYDPGDFSESDSCVGFTLAANGICPINLVFAPPHSGPRMATLKETDSGTGGPRTINMMGTGLTAAMAVTVFPGSLAFSAQQTVGTGSGPQFFSVTSSGANPLGISSVVSTDAVEFPVIFDTCSGYTFPPGKSCMVAVMFTPTSAGNRSATIKVADKATGNPQEVLVSGFGVAVQASSVTLAANRASVAFGNPVTLTATVTDQNGNPITNGNVTFLNGTTVLGAVQVVGNASGGGTVGTARLTTFLIPLGANGIVASYAGAATSRVSAPVTVTVTGKYPSTASFVSSGSAGTYTFAATVAGVGPAVPMGSVTFTDGTTGVVQGSAAIDPATLKRALVPLPEVDGLPAPNAVALVDVNGDGIPDLITGTRSNGIMVQIGNGDGSFQAGNNFAGFFSISALAFGDFNGDGKLDIAVSGSMGAGVLLGNGDGTFQEMVSIYDPGGANGIAVGDFNGDGKLDLVAANTLNRTVDLLLGDGDGTFEEPILIPAGAVISIAAGDLNGDGNLDVVVGDATSIVGILLGHGNGTFVPLQTYAIEGVPGYLALADLRGVGRLDVLTIDDSNSVNMMLGNGDGSFEAERTILAGSSYNAIAVGDLNGDGKTDLAISDFGQNTVDVLYGNADGAFPASASYATEVNPDAVALADLNHDGMADLAVANAGDDSDVVLLNQVTQTATLSNAAVFGSGAHAVSGTYSGDANFGAKVSNSLELIAGLVRPTVQLAALPSANVAWGQTLSVAVSLGGPFSFIPAPTGTVSYSVDGGPTKNETLVGGSVSMPIDPLCVATHMVSVSYSGDQNYTPIAGQALALTVFKAEQTIAFNALPNVTYGAAPIAISASSTSGLPLVYAVVSGPAIIANGILTIMGAGTVTVSANQAGTVAYCSAPAVLRSFTVANAAPLSVAVNSAGKVYGAAPPIFSGTVLGMVNGDQITVTYSSTGSASSPVGVYPIAALLSGAALANYDAPVVTNGTLTITAAALAVIANGAGRVYGAANPAFTAIVTGFVNGDATGVVSGSAAMATSATASSGVGVYSILPALGTLAAANYTFSMFVHGTLTISQATPAIAWAAPGAIPYGAALCAAQLDAGMGGVAGKAVYSPAAGMVLGAGTHTLLLTFTPADTADYTSATAAVSLTVNRATPTMSWAAPAAILYGTALSGMQLEATSPVAGTFAYTPPPGTVLIAGSHALSVTLTPADTTDYTTATAMVSLTVNKAVSTIDWAAPAAISFGTALSGTQLNASSPVAGSFAYSPSLGTVLSAGSHVLSVTLAPADAVDYAAATATVTLTVNRVTPVIAWASPAAIVYGTALGAVQLDATSTTAGTFAYTPASGTVLAAGSQTLSVIFTPTDLVDDTSATATVQLTVNEATPAVAWATPASISYGTALSGTQLNASSPVAGSFVYRPACGFVPGAGSQTLAVTFTPTDKTDYTTATASVTWTVTKATPTISWTAPVAISYGTALNRTQLDASSPVPGNFVYSPVSGEVPTAGSQTLSVTLTPTDTSDYTAATTTVILTVNKATPTIKWAAPAAISYGTALSASQLNASSLVAGSLAYTPSSGTLLTAGLRTLTVTLTPADTADYAAVTTTVSITVNKATPAIGWATPAPVLFGTALSATQLDAISGVPGTFAYSPASGTQLSIGSHTLSVTLTSIDSTDYTTAAASVTLLVNPAPPVTLSATSLSFGGLTVGTTSASQTVTVTNTGSATLILSSITLTGPNASAFMFANNCGTSLAVLGSCTIHGHFTPQAEGAMTAVITIGDNAAGSPQSISLSGTGANTTLTLSPGSLNFGVAGVGVTSASQTVTLTNTGAGTLSIGSIGVTGANASSFVFANSCGASLAAGGTCTIHGHFTPAAAGALTAAVTIVDSAAGSPHSIPVSGEGVSQGSTMVSLSATVVVFGIQEIGTTSQSQSVTLTNTGSTPLYMVSVTVSGADASSFVFASSCGTTVAPGASCTIHGHFTPVVAGALAATVNIIDSAAGSPQSFTVAGTGD